MARCTVLLTVLTLITAGAIKAQPKAPGAEPKDKSEPCFRCTLVIGYSQVGQLNAQPVAVLSQRSAPTAFSNSPPASTTRRPILALADCPRERIAARFGVPEATVATAESLFVDVRESLHATTWIAGFVIQPALRAGNLSLATKYRAALYGGPLVAEALLDAEHRIPLNDVQRLADQEMLLHAKLLQAIEVPLDNSDSAQQFLKIQFDYQYRKQRLAA